MVSLGPHDYINQAEGLDSSVQSPDKEGSENIERESGAKNGLSMASLVELEHIKMEQRQEKKRDSKRLITDQAVA